MEILFQFVLPATLVAFLVMVLFWYWGRSRDNYAVIDVGWGIVISSILWVYYLAKNGFSFEITSFTLTILVQLWAMRLSLFLYLTRILPRHAEDKRYTSFRKDYGDKVHQKFFTNVFLFQGFLALILTSPLLVAYIGEDNSLSWFSAVGLALFFFGELGESLADQQLSKFKQDSSNQGKVCNKGLWKYSRHPNYFFEWVIWLGISVFALNFSWIGILPAIFMYVLLVYVTGVPYAEKFSLLSKPIAYVEYQNSTSPFFPWFPRKK
jgi:steroid 5-alpha reductase family enzyme